ncbi:secreted immunoglobulin domain 4 [Cottoperca gobio]|uniref:secreted immunoglobulin domain 4 n=1 Tax=Cottoperca gobio TaxID=56716 RepID=UPI00110F0E96|nr:basement membrane-specific heparan sulfate proteoglycan core protein-like [Cottoperca gobio]
MSVLRNQFPLSGLERTQFPLPDLHRLQFPQTPTHVFPLTPETPVSPLTLEIPMFPSDCRDPSDSVGLSAWPPERLLRRPSGRPIRPAYPPASCRPPHRPPRQPPPRPPLRLPERLCPHPARILPGLPTGLLIGPSCIQPRLSDHLAVLQSGLLPRLLRPLDPPPARLHPPLSPVISFCAVSSQAPVVSVEPRAATVRQGETVSFRCQVGSGAPPIQLQWKRANNKALPDNAKTGPDGSVLTVANARPENQGQYRCLAANPAGRSTASAVLNVKHAPQVRLTPAEPLRVRLGEPVSVECRATGRPRPILTWKRQGSTLQLVTKETNDVNTIQWPAVHPEDSGVYICQAKNSEGMAEVKVEVIVKGQLGAPVASVGATEMTVVEGHTITMACQASGSPLPVITWSKLRAPLPWKHTMAGGILTLTSVGRQDSGQYICNATNMHGYSEAYTQMEVESPPYATSLPDQVRLQPGDALSVQCLAHGSHPIQFEWSRGSRAGLPPGAESTKDGKLLIAHVKLSDSGTYKCVATNHIGSSEALVKVIIKA